LKINETRAVFAVKKKNVFAPIGCYMNSMELLDKINIILANESRKASSTPNLLGLRKYICTIENERGTQHRNDICAGQMSAVLNDTYEKAELVFENLELLLKLYNSIKNKDFLCRDFTSALLHDLREGDWARTYLPFEALIKIGKLDIALLVLTDSKYLVQSHRCLADLTELLRFETKQFSSEEIKKIESQVSKIEHGAGEYQTLADTILAQINEIKHRQLRKELGEINSFEIERDKEEVKQKLKEQKFDIQLIKAIDRLSQKYDSAVTDEEFNECLSQARKVIDNLQQEIAKKIIKKTSKSIKGKITITANVRDYLKEQKLITEKEHGLIKGIYGFISDEGTHKLISTKDQARLGKNMLIECSLLLLKNSEKYQL